MARPTVAEKIVIDIVTTTKIQATIKGKKRTLRMWRLPIHVPIIFSKHIKTYLKDAKNEALCDLRTPEEWVDFIRSTSMTPEMRGWVTSVIWWHFGSGGGNDALYDYHKSFGDINQHKFNVDEMVKQLDKMGISKVCNKIAAEREKKRDSKLEMIIGFYLKGEKL